MNYLQTAWGDSLDSVSPADIQKTIEALRQMDDEHGAFWVGMNDEEAVLETHKDLRISAIFDDDPDNELRVQAMSWKEVSDLYHLLLAGELDALKAALRQMPDLLTPTRNREHPRPPEPQEYSLSGDPVYKYDGAKQRAFTPAIGDGENIEAISAHIEEHIGPVETVFHEIVSDLVHIDVHWVKPTEKFPFHALVTSGMSDLPMNVPEGLEELQYAELCILLPNDWTIDGTNFQTMEEAFKEEKNYWPVRWLKYLARFPHQYDTWLGYGHTLPNGEEAVPYADNTQLGCMILLPSITLGKDFYEFKISDEKTIHFFCLYPLYKEEMDFKLKNNSSALIDKFAKYRIMDVVDINRRNTCRKKGFLGLW